MKSSRSRAATPKRARRAPPQPNASRVRWSVVPSCQSAKKSKTQRPRRGGATGSASGAKGAGSGAS